MYNCFNQRGPIVYPGFLYSFFRWLKFFAIVYPGFANS